MAKIMIVEDDKNLSAIYKDRLLAEGYEIVAAHDGEEALAMAVNEKPNLIIADVMMPKISGFDMLDILRSTPETKNTRVIMMTALSQAEDQQRAAKLGADKYLVKSQVTLDDVARVVREVLEGVGATVNVSNDAPMETNVTPPEQTTASTVPPEPQQIFVNVANNEPQAPNPVSAEPTISEPAPVAQEIAVNNNPLPNLADQMQSTAEEKAELENQIEQLANSLPSEPQPSPVDNPVSDIAVSPEIIASTENPTPSASSPELSQNKPDIMKLYEEEMAKEQSPASQSQTDNQPTPTGPENTSPTSPSDPHSISL